GSLPGVIEDTTILANAIGSWADPDMPDDVAYELVKTLWNHMDEQKERFTSTAINKKTIAYMPVTDAFFQPGALKFYNEVGAPRTSWVHQGF
ncbi:MAG: TAXI family TRAP transporter solute-binding subunit, partial [Chloroflexota bacterium]